MWPAHSAQNYSFHLPTNLFLYPIIRPTSRVGCFSSSLCWSSFLSTKLPPILISSWDFLFAKAQIVSETRRDEDGGRQQKSQVPFSIKEDCLKQFIKAYNFCFNSLALHGIPHRSTAVHPSARGKEYHICSALKCTFLKQEIIFLFFLVTPNPKKYFTIPTSYSQRAQWAKIHIHRWTWHT